MNNSKIAIKWGKVIQLVDYNQILFIEADGNYSKFHLKDATIIPSEKGLKALEKELENSGFIRIHKSTLVNINNVNLFDFSNQPKALLINKKTLIVSRAKAILISKQIKLNSFF